MLIKDTKFYLNFNESNFRCMRSMCSGIEFDHIIFLQENQKMLLSVCNNAIARVTNLEILYYIQSLLESFSCFYYLLSKKKKLSKLFLTF